MAWGEKLVITDSHASHPDIWRKQNRSEQKEDARATALAAVPGGKVLESELEDEDGRLIYSFDIEAADGTHDVEVDAITGVVLQSALENEDEDHDDDTEDGKAEHRSRRVQRLRENL